MTRVAAQQLRIAQMKADPNMLNAKLLEGVNLDYAGTKESVVKARNEGFVPTEGALGNGVYFTAEVDGYLKSPDYQADRFTAHCSVTSRFWTCRQWTELGPDP